MTRVVDVSNSASFEDAAVMKFFEASTRNLLAQNGPGRHRPAGNGGCPKAATPGEKLLRRTDKGSQSTPSSPTQFFEFLKQLADISSAARRAPPANERATPSTSSPPNAALCSCGPARHGLLRRSDRPIPAAK